MSAYRRVYDSRHLQADYQEPRSAPEPYAWQSSVGNLHLYIVCVKRVLFSWTGHMTQLMLVLELRYTTRVCLRFLDSLSKKRVYIFHFLW